ncbi:MAG: hypothetical protein IJL48_06880 [Bacteroidales bacterium]|nr:hypothetical protein [Bacteroidales bacterium]
MKTRIINLFCFAILMVGTNFMANSQVANTTDLKNKVDAQLVSLKGDKRTGEIRPVLKLKGTSDWTEIDIHQPIAWNADGEILTSPYNDGDVHEKAIITNGIWTKFIVGRWFRLLDPTRSMESISILRIPFSSPGLQYYYGYDSFDFIDVPVEWEEPETAPTSVAKRLDLQPFSGVSYYLWEDNVSPSYYDGHYLEGEVRLECVSQDNKKGITTLTLQLKVNNPKEENGQTQVYIGRIKYIDDKGTYKTIIIKKFFNVQKEEWTELEVKTTEPIFHKEVKSCKWLQISVKNEKSGREHFLTAYDVPIYSH